MEVVSQYVNNLLKYSMFVSTFMVVVQVIFISKTFTRCAYQFSLTSIN